MTAVETRRDAPAAAAERALPDIGWRLESLWDASPADGRPVRGGALPPALAARFAGDLVIPLHVGRPTIIANFVSTLDGVVALDRHGATGGREVSGGFEPDRFLMGLLRATADAVLVGAGTVRASHTRAWTPDRVHPPSAAGYAAWRRALGLAPAPAAVIVSASGVLDPSRVRQPSPDQATIIVTTSEGARRLRAERPLPGAEIVARGHGDRVAVEALLDVLASRGFELVVAEAGPTLFGQLLAADAIDELFLTLAPRIAGRSDEVPRLGLVERVSFGPQAIPAGRLVRVMRAADHVFLRFAFDQPDHRERGRP
jgi:riboflavin biosynthesis pyrimidine reductase